MYTIEELRERVLEGVERYNAKVPHERRIVRIELFGSYAAGRQNEDSDLDLLVEFAIEQVSLFNIIGVLEAMEETTGMSVDVVQIPLPQGALLDVERTVSLYAAA